MKIWRQIVSELEANASSEFGFVNLFDARGAARCLSHSLWEQNLFEDAVKVYETSFLASIKTERYKVLHELSWIHWVRSGRGDIAVFADDGYKAHLEANRLLGELVVKEEGQESDTLRENMGKMAKNFEEYLKRREWRKKDPKKYATEQRLLEQVQRNKEKAADDKALASDPERQQKMAAAEAEAKAKEAAEKAIADKAAEDFLNSLVSDNDEKKGKKGKGKGKS